MDQITLGSDNIFADLGFPNPEEHLAKANLVIAISREIEARKLTQTEAAKLLGIDQPKMSRILRGHFRGYSIERLARFLNRLDQDVEFRVRPKPKSADRAGQTRVLGA